MTLSYKTYKAFDAICTKKFMWKTIDIPYISKIEISTATKLTFIEHNTHCRFEMNCRLKNIKIMLLGIHGMSYARKKAHHVYSDARQ